MGKSMRMNIPKQVFDALERLSGPGRPARGGLRVFPLCQATA